MRVAAPSALPLIANRIRGKNSGKTSRARWRNVRRIERRAIAAICSAAGARAQRPRRPRLLRRPAPPRPRSRRALELAPGLCEEDVVERRLVQDERGDVQRGCIERADELGKLRLAAGQLDDDLPVAARRRAELLRASRAGVSAWSWSAGTTSTVGLPISAFRRSGVSSATMWPWSMMPTRSASASASSRYCVVRKTVMPSSRARRATSSHSAVRLCRSRPVVGSSRKRIRGRVDEREGQVEASLHAARVAADPAIGRLGQPDALEQLVRRARALCLRKPLERRL